MRGLIYDYDTNVISEEIYYVEQLQKQTLSCMLIYGCISTKSSEISPYN